MTCRNGDAVSRGSLRKRLRAALLAATALATLAISNTARAVDGSEIFDGRPAADWFMLSVNGMSANGRFIFGNSYDPTGTYIRGWIYSGGKYTLVPQFVPDRQTSIYDINNAGNVWVGMGQLADYTNHAVRFANGVFTDLHSGAAFAPGGSLENYDSSVAVAMSANTSIVAGTAASTMGTLQAVRWTQATGMTGLGFLPGGYNNTVAAGISADGTTLIVNALNGPYTQAAYWTQAPGMVPLGFFPGGSQSNATAVNANGSVIVGGALTSASEFHAFRWTQATGMQDLGTLPGTQYSIASVVRADGAIVGGTGSDTINNRSFAFRWTDATGMQKLADLLAARGIQLPGGLVPSTTIAMSADGRIVIGAINGPNGTAQSYYIARCQSAICRGLTTYDQMANSYAGQSAVGQTANAAIGGSLGTMQEYATQAMQSQGSRTTPYSVFGYGAYDSDPVASGTLGITADLPFGLVTGFTASANYVQTDMVYGGNSKMYGGAFGAFIAHAPDTGLQALLGGSLLTLRGDITRGSFNGITPVTSTGSTTGNGYGGIARLGWGFAVAPQVTATPFASYTVAQTRFDGYREISGVFATQFDGFTSTSQVSRVGVDARYTFAPNSWVWGRAAWGHRLDDGKGPSITGTLIDAPFSYTSPGLSSAMDWAEVGGGVRLPAWTNGAVLASVTASITPNQTTTYVSRLGVTQAF